MVVGGVVVFILCFVLFFGVVFLVFGCFLEVFFGIMVLDGFFGYLALCGK